MNGNQKMAIVMDGAGWHKSGKLILLKNIKIIILPPYSPELNPTEKLWQYIKDHTMSRIIPLRTGSTKLFVNWRMQFVDLLEQN